MPKRIRIPILGDTGSPIGRVFRAWESGEREVRPLAEYQRRPADFLTDVLGIPRHTIVWSENAGYEGHKWDGTSDPLARALDVLAGKVPGKRHVAIEAATGTNKTYTAAGLVLWFLACFEDALVITNAPKEKQLKEGIWKEIGAHLRKFSRRFPHMQAIELKIRMRPTIANPFGTGTASDTIRQEKWSALGWCAGVDAGAESAVRSQGFHSEHMLIVIEEMPGADPAIVTALKNTCTAPHNIILGLGNPDHQHDPLHLFSELADVERIQISAYDHPNVVCDREVVPGATSPTYIASMLAEHGEDGPLYLSRVRGQSPTEAADALIKREWCEAAIGRYNDQRLRTGFRAWGVDVANSENGDKGAIARGIGRCLLQVEAKRCPDANKLGAEVVDEMRATSPQGRAQHIGIDSVGVGAGAVNEAKRLGVLVKALNGGARAIATMDEELDVDGDREQVRNEERFANLRAQMHWQLREDLRVGRIALPDDPELVADLVTPKYWTKNGKVFVEPKEEIKKRLGRSPNKGDAAVYWNWVRDRSRDQSELVEEDESGGVSPELWAQHVDRVQRPGYYARLTRESQQQQAARNPLMSVPAHLLDPDYGAM